LLKLSLQVQRFLPGLLDLELQLLNVVSTSVIGAIQIVELLLVVSAMCHLVYHVVALLRPQFAVLLLDLILQILEFFVQGSDCFSE
jgi:hypothetical protein